MATLVKQQADAQKHRCVIEHGVKICMRCRLHSSCTSFPLWSMDRSLWPRPIVHPQALDRHPCLLEKSWLPLMKRTCWSYTVTALGKPCTYSADIGLHNPRARLWNMFMHRPFLLTMLLLPSLLTGPCPLWRRKESSHYRSQAMQPLWFYDRPIVFAPPGAATCQVLHPKHLYMANLADMKVLACRS